MNLMFFMITVFAYSSIALSAVNSCQNAIRISLTVVTFIKSAICVFWAKLMLVLVIAGIAKEVTAALIEAFLVTRFTLFILQTKRTLDEAVFAVAVVSMLKVLVAALTRAISADRNRTEPTFVSK
jgi:hypothetical protein